MALARMVTVVAALVLATGCGSESSPDATDTATTSAPPPKVYSVEELKAALPTKDDIPDALQVKHLCPGDEDKDFCTEMSEGESASTDIDLIPAGANSPSEMEMAAGEKITQDSVDVRGWQHESVAAATKSLEKFRVANDEFDGAYDIKQKKDGKYITPAEKGTGTAKELSVDGWEGMIGTRTGSFAVYDNSMQRQYTVLIVAKGGTTILVSVSTEDKERPADYADKLARQVLADYLGRLG